MIKHTRRHVLGFVSAAGGSLLAGPRAVFGQTSPRHVPVAVVGGGVAGLFAAVRLRKEGQQDVALFESSDRLGGRLLSVKIPGLDGLVAEVGGMRFTNLDKNLLKLIESYIGTDQLAPFDYPTRFWHLRGQKLTSLDDPESLPYHLDPEEADIVRAGKNLLVETLDQYRRDAQTSGQMDRGLWQYLLETRSKEAYNFISDSLGYYTPVRNWNLSQIVPWFNADFRPGISYHVLKGGYERLPHALSQDFISLGGGLHLEHRLRSLHRRADGIWVLDFETPDGAQRVTAEKVILALPRLAIERLDVESDPLRDADFRAALATVNSIPLSKVHFAFKDAWWEKLGFTTGRAITDLPLRQAYYWGKDPESGHGLMMASYHDGRALSFWQELAGGPRYGDLEWLAGAEGPDGQPLAPSMARWLPASRLLVEETMRQLEVLHGPGVVSAPYAATHMNWGVAPWGAAYHLWTIGVDAAETIAYMQQPMPNLHVCGEAWSVAQGWVEGAIETTDSMLQAKFGLPAYA
ncbi:MAG: NAD(P)/FAD-dependent oxidoreductase [Pseudomonadota bacterium]